MRSPFRRLIAAILFAACALGLSGCIVISGESTGQPTVIGNLVIHTDVCFSSDFSMFGGGPNFGCPNGNSGDPTFFPGFQALVAYRVPDFVTLPATLTSSSGTAVTLTQNAGYTSQLTAKAPTPTGDKWIGYVSDPIATPGSGFSLDLSISLPRGTIGTPFVGPFNYRTVTGYRDTPPGDPVDCGSDVTATNPGTASGPNTICVDSPSASDLAKDNAAPTRDLGVLSTPGPGSDQAAQGTSTAAVPFALKFAGPAGPAAAFKVAAATTIPGARAVPATSDYAPPTDSTTPVGVGLDIPPTAPVGTYNVTLTASLPNGQTRSQTVAVNVVSGAPVNTGAAPTIINTPRQLRRPRLSGIVAVGQVVACTYGDWNYAPTRFTRVWTRDGKTITGATHQHYLVKPADGGHRLGCTETAYNAAGTGMASATPMTPPRATAARKKKPRRVRR